MPAYLLFLCFFFLAYRLCLLYAGFSPSRHPFSLFPLFSMPISLALCRLFSFTGILFLYFLFLACRSRLLYASFSPSPASFFSIFSFWHADHACSMPAFLFQRHPFSLFSLFGMPIMLTLCRLCLIEARFS